MSFFNRVKKEAKALYTDVCIELTQNHRSYRRWFKNTTFIATFAHMAVFLLADGITPDALSETISSKLTEIYSASFGVITIIAALAMTGALIMRFTGNQQRAAQGTQWAVRIGVTYALINLVGFIFSLIDNMTDGGNDRFLNDSGGTSTTPVDTSPSPSSSGELG